MHEGISDILRQTEREFGCRILFACESGSRAWGFASPDSDFDVRFIYAHPVEWYLRLDNLPDTVDAMLPGDIDLGGWELRKTLKLFAGCNLALNEWLNSPEVYSSEPAFHQQLQLQIPRYFKPKAAGCHYLRMARNTLEAHPLKSGMRGKKLFYILRPLLALQWISARRSMPPTAFEELLNAGLAPEQITGMVRELQTQKQNLNEAQPIDVPNETIHWIKEALAQAESQTEALPAWGNRDLGALNALMREWVNPSPAW